MNNKCEQCYYDCNSECAYRICIDEVDGLRKEIMQLKQALKISSPYYSNFTCRFCSGKYGNHADNCEYLKLCGGAKGAE